MHLQIRMSWRCSIPLRFPASVTPCALDEAAMSSPEDWTPSLEGAPTGLSLVGSSAKEREILLTAAPVRLGRQGCGRGADTCELSGPPGVSRYPSWLVGH